MFRLFSITILKMNTKLYFFVVSLLMACNSSQPDKETTPSKQLDYRTFSFQKRVTLPGHPEAIYDAITGDVSPWWDHTFAEKPLKLYIEAKPGGGFYEIFDEEGNGVKHASVIYADRGKLLRMDGPLGLSGKAVQIVSSYTFRPVGSDSTFLQLDVHGAGELTEDLPGIVEKVWEHFIFERFEPYVLKGRL